MRWFEFLKDILSGAARTWKILATFFGVISIGIWLFLSIATNQVSWLSQFVATTGPMRPGAELWQELYRPVLYRNETAGERSTRLAIYGRIEELLKRRPPDFAEIRRLFPSLPPVQATPPSGTFFGERSEPRTELLAVDAVLMKSDVQVLLCRRSLYSLDTTNSSFVVRRGERTGVLIPPGTYDIYIVTGLAWFGDTYGLLLGGKGRRIVDKPVHFAPTEQEASLGRGIFKQTGKVKVRGESLVLVPFDDDPLGFREIRVKKTK